MGRQHASSPERNSGRLYYGESYEDSPAPLPLATRGLSAAFTRRRAVLVRTANETIRDINHALGDNNASTSPAPPESAPRRPTPELEEDFTIAKPAQRRRLGSHAVTFASSEDIPAEQQAT